MQALEPVKKVTFYMALNLLQRKKIWSNMEKTNNNATLATYNYDQSERVCQLLFFF